MSTTPSSTSGEGSRLLRRITGHIRRLSSAERIEIQVDQRLPTIFEDTASDPSSSPDHPHRVSSRAPQLPPLSRSARPLSEDFTLTLASLERLQALPSGEAIDLDQPTSLNQTSNLTSAEMAPRRFFSSNQGRNSDRVASPIPGSPSLASMNSLQGFFPIQTSSSNQSVSLIQGFSSKASNANHQQGSSDRQDQSNGQASKINRTSSPLQGVVSASSASSARQATFHRSSTLEVLPPQGRHISSGLDGSVIPDSDVDNITQELDGSSIQSQIPHSVSIKYLPDADLAKALKLNVNAAELLAQERAAFDQRFPGTSSLNKVNSIEKEFKEASEETRLSAALSAALLAGVSAAEVNPTGITADVVRMIAELMKFQQTPQRDAGIRAILETIPKSLGVSGVPEPGSQDARLLAVLRKLENMLLKE